MVTELPFEIVPEAEEMDGAAETPHTNTETNKKNTTLTTNTGNRKKRYVIVLQDFVRIKLLFKWYSVTHRKELK